MSETTTVFVFEQDAPTQPQFQIKNFQEFFATSTECVLSGGSAAAGAAACRNGGYRQYTDSEGNDFRDAGECTRYVARGGLLFTRP